MDQFDEVLDDEGKGLHRRQFLVAGAAAGVTAAAPLNFAQIAQAKKVPFAKGGKFKHGVSSGFPTDDAVTLWTRLSGVDRTSKLRLEVAKDKGFRRVVKRAVVKAVAHDDFTVHQRVKGLKPGHEYYYRFETKNKHSRVGRFRTLPPKGSKHQLKIGFWSCQSYEAGFYNAQAGLAKEEDLDFVVMLGDYIYERHFFDGPAERVDRTGVNRDGNVQTLAEYRQKYRLVQSDPDLQALHARYPMVSVWDDHEVEDNYAGDEQDSAEPDPNKENDGTPRRIPFLKRRKNGYRSYFEATPRIRMKSDANQIYGSYRVGALADLFLTDQRQYRDVQPCNDPILEPCPDTKDPGRTMLGAKQKKWFKKAVPQSKAKWKIWGSELMLMSIDVPKGSSALVDAWDGYEAERQEILSSFKSKGVENFAVITGDIHTFFAGNLSTTGDDTGAPIGVEFVGGSATSFGIPETLGVDAGTLTALGLANNPHLKYANLESRGYGVLTIKERQIRCDLRGVDALTDGAKPTTLASFVANAGSPEVQEV